MRAQIVHLSGPRRGRTRTYADANLLVGSDADAHVRFPAGCGVAPRHAEIAYSGADCAFFLRALDGLVFVNRRQVGEVQLADSDLVELGAGGPKLRFHVYVPPGAVCKPVRMMLADAGAVAEQGGVFAFTRSLTRDLLTHATWQLKVFFPLVVLAIVVVVAGLAGWLGARAPVRAIAARQQAENALLARIHDEYVRGVCLVHGIYGFRRANGSQRFLETDAGDRLEIEYTGSGFLATDTGAILTNRHVVRPWLGNEQWQAIARLGFEPQFFHFSLTFPGHGPLEVDPMQARTRDDDLDVAVLSVPTDALVGVPVLPLSPRKPDLERGHRVNVIGYPLGLRAILAKTDRALVSQLTGNPNATQAEVIAGLAAANAIRPLVTQGVLCDVTAASLVYDAGTTSGGSGGPVLGEDGNVIGVNYAILKGFDSSNFGVPIRYARELLGH